MKSEDFQDYEAKRTKVPLLVGITSASGAGKTYSALRLATGIVSVTGGDIFYVDTEASRALHYADKFKFRHVPFAAPFNPLRYLAAAHYCQRKGAGVIVFDSFSHEHSGVGGVLDMHEEELNRIAGNDYKKREKCSALAWSKPKAERGKMIDGLVQMNANFIFCFRAQEKLDWKNKDERGQPKDLGWQPIGALPMVYEMSARALLQPNAKGIPDWNPELPGEAKLVKVPEQFEALFKRFEGQPMCEEIGVEMARWAQGEPPKPTPYQELVGAIAMAKAPEELKALVANIESCKRERRVSPKEVENLRMAWEQQSKKLEG